MKVAGPALLACTLATGACTTTSRFRRNQLPPQLATRDREGTSPVRRIVVVMGDGRAFEAKRLAVAEDRLLVEDADGDLQAVPLASVERVEIERLSGGQTILATVGILVLTGIFVGAVILASVL